MFRRLGMLAARYPLRIIAAWIVVLVAVLVSTPKLSDVVSSSQASYLPSDANSQRAALILQQAFPRTYSRSTAIVVARAARRPTGRRIRILRLRRAAPDPGPQRCSLGQFDAGAARRAGQPRRRAG